MGELRGNAERGCPPFVSDKKHEIKRSARGIPTPLYCTCVRVSTSLPNERTHSKIHSFHPEQVSSISLLVLTPYTNQHDQKKRFESGGTTLASPVLKPFSLVWNENHKNNNLTGGNPNISFLFTPSYPLYIIEKRDAAY